MQHTICAYVHSIMGTSESKHTDSDLCDEVRSVSSESVSENDVIGDYVMAFEYIDNCVKNHKRKDRITCSCEFCKHYIPNDSSKPYNELLELAIQRDNLSTFKELWGKEPGQDRFPADAISILIDIPAFDASKIASFLFREDLGFAFEYTYYSFFMQFVRCCRCHSADKCMTIINERYPALYAMTIRKLDKELETLIAHADKLKSGRVNMTFITSNHSVVICDVLKDDITSFCMCRKCKYKFPTKKI